MTTYGLVVGGTEVLICHVVRCENARTRVDEGGAMITRFSKKRKKDEKSMDYSEPSISLIARVRRG